jgi:hypothetical protein
MKDVLIVGFGIAGLSVAIRLQERSKSFDVISDESQQSSKVAGGVLNPVVLKRYNLAWNAQILMPEALQFYTDITGGDYKLVQDIPIIKLFSSIEDQNNWMVASDQPQLEAYLDSKASSTQAQIKSPFKAGQVHQTRLIHIHKLLNYHQERLELSSQFYKDTFAYDDLIIKDNHVIYGQNMYKTIVFCEGFGITQNPFFNWLPIYGNKGEYLIFKSKRLNANRCILKSRHFIIPLGNDIYKYGATYSREKLNHNPTSDAKQQLVEQLSKIIDCDYRIIDQQAGIRPTVPDRKPILGAHPQYKHLFVLNGFGSRGIMAAPYLSQQLINLMYSNVEIDNEVSIHRFLKHFS